MTVRTSGDTIRRHVLRHVPSVHDGKLSVALLRPDIGLSLGLITAAAGRAARILEATAGMGVSHT